MAHEVVDGLYFTGEFYFEVNPDPGSVVILGGYALPGLVRVKAPKFEAKIDAKEAKGANGATMSMDGMKPATGEIEIEVFTAAQYQELVLVLGTLKPPDGKGSPQPWEIVHPFFNGMGIQSVVIKDIEGPGFGKTPGTYSAKLSLLEWRQAWAAGGSSTPTSPVTSKKPSATPSIHTVFDQAVSASGVVGPPTPPAPTEAGPLRP